MAATKAFAKANKLAKANKGSELTQKDILDLICQEHPIHNPALRWDMENSPYFGAISQLAMIYITQEWSAGSEAKDLKNWILKQMKEKGLWEE